MSVKPFLEIRIAPGVVKPVSRVGRGLTGLFGNRLVGRPYLLEQGITLAGLRHYTSLASCIREHRFFSLPGMPCLSAKAFNWLSVHVSRIQSLTLDQAVWALSSVSYHEPFTCETRESLLADAESLVSTPFCFRYAWSCAESHELYGVTT
jgi:hypothetical protein